MSQGWDQEFQRRGGSKDASTNPSPPTGKQTWASGSPRLAGQGPEHLTQRGEEGEAGEGREEQQSQTLSSA